MDISKLPTEDQLSYKIIGCAYDVFKKLGPGFLESVYEKALLIELKNAGLKAESQVELDVIYDGVPLGMKFRVDVIVEDKIIIELKSVDSIQPIHKKQLLSYLKMSNKHLGLLINFNVHDLKSGITRILNGYNNSYSVL